MKAAIAPIVERLAALDPAVACAHELRAALGDLKRLRSWTDAREAAVVAALETAVSFPERAITETQQVPFRDAERTLARAQFLRDVPAFATALERGAITVGHVDAVLRAAKKIEPNARAVLLGQADRLVVLEASLDVDAFTRRLKQRCEQLRSDDHDDARLERQRQATSLRTWVDQITGMWCFHAELDPVTGLLLDQALRAQLERLFHDKLPDTAPSDPLVRQQHLAALAFADLVLNPGGASRVRPEVVAVIDVSDGPAQIEWNLPIEVPKRVMDALLGQADLSVVGPQRGRPPRPRLFGRGPQQTHRQPGPTTGIARLLPLLRHPRLHRRVRPVQDPPPPLLGEQRRHRPGKPAPRLQQTPPLHPRQGLGRDHGSRPLSPHRPPRRHHHDHRTTQPTPGRLNRAGTTSST